MDACFKWWSCIQCPLTVVMWDIKDFWFKIKQITSKHLNIYVPFDIPRELFVWVDPNKNVIMSTENFLAATK